ncbi:hypothetical protein [Novosphingobium naphthalenivorans]|uniref:hypothetical protein n=1 Tax=Novosphingobium naphthalenivorans TaxID=273168 RepID=UPI0012EE6573|nr:hypothetical protein [Novosphingobium naphthalenivorans]
MAALSGLDITAQPGAPGSTAERAGGIKPTFRLEKADDHMTWYVMSGDKVATTMTAYFQPIDEGRQTRVTASVKRGDAPDDFVSPAFRSNGLTMGLFTMALEGELNKLVQPGATDLARCDEIMAEFQRANEADAGSRDNLAQAMGGTAKTMLRLHATEAELRRNGCPVDDNNGEFRSVKSEMGPPPGGITRDGPEARAEEEGGGWGKDTLSASAP